MVGHEGLDIPLCRNSSVWKIVISKKARLLFLANAINPEARVRKITGEHPRYKCNQIA